MTGIVGDAVLDRGVAQMGYAAVSQAGLRKDGEIIEADLAEVVRRHLADMCELAAELGVPRDRLFTHAGGWKEGEALYQSAVNPFSCPGWSVDGGTGQRAVVRGRSAAPWRNLLPFRAETFKVATHVFA